jgi:hypothetical protein
MFRFMESHEGVMSLVGERDAGGLAIQNRIREREGEMNSREHCLMCEMDISLC